MSGPLMDSLFGLGIRLEIVCVVDAAVSFSDLKSLVKIDDQWGLPCKDD